jgi:hypothetical protein
VVLPHLLSDAVAGDEDQPVDRVEGCLQRAVFIVVGISRRQTRVLEDGLRRAGEGDDGHGIIEIEQTADRSRSQAPAGTGDRHRDWRRHRSFRTWDGLRLRHA